MIRVGLYFPLSVLVMVLAGCSTTAPKTTRTGAYYLNDGPLAGVSQETIDRIPEPRPQRLPLVKGTLRPYSALGKEYVPLTVLARFVERGVGTWYGSRYAGRSTSSGEPYDPLKLTAAHPTLPLPCFARITNLDNGKSIIVKINDRGPFLKGRIVDLSYAAARRLGYASKGSANVELEVILP